MLSIVQAAGWPIYLLIACSILMLAIVIERWIQLRPKKINPPGLAQQAARLAQMQVGDAAALEHLAQSSLLGRILAAGLKARSVFGANGKEIDTAMEQTGRQSRHALEKHLALLGTIASVAPLMGLFGTVVGMIEIFGAQGGGISGAAESGNPVELAHGISVALYNTAYGLLVAIPALLFWRYFRSQVDTYTLQLEISAERFSRYLCQTELPDESR